MKCERETGLTNRDLYLAIAAPVADRKHAPERALEEYLRALLRGARAHRAVEALRPDQFLSLLAEAFRAEPLPYDPAWPAGYRHVTERVERFEQFEAVALRQVVDLREMRDASILEGEWIFFGVDAPRGGRWYNFHPHQYLECAAQGLFGGWAPGDATGRQFVPGEVAVLGPDGRITSADARELDRPVYELASISWEQLADFLVCGQTYE